jgi:hypothetical protein
VLHTKEKKNANSVWAIKPEAKSPFGKVWHRWEDNMNIELRGTGRESVN